MSGSGMGMLVPGLSLTTRWSRRLKFGLHRHYYRGWTLRLGLLSIERQAREDAGA